jgi:ABC-type multidrug transport system fused ATPase/permease subunit
MKTFKELLFILSSRERKYLVLLVIMIIIMSLLDVISVASILPFITVLANPGNIENNIILNTMFQALGRFGVETNQEFVFFLGLFLFIFLVISLTFKSIATYAQTKFIFMTEYSIGKRLLEGYLNQPYSWFLSHHSADLGKNILSEISQIIGNGIAPLMILIANGILTIALVSLLVIFDPKLALIVISSISFSYLFIFYFVKNFLNQAGNDRFKSNKFRFTTIIEAFSAAKEIKVGGLEKTYTENFSNCSIIYAKTQALLAAVSTLPRFILEAIAFGGILLIIFYTTAQSVSFNNSLPIISLYVLAGYRLMPALQQIYVSLTHLTFVGPSIEKLNTDLKNLRPFNKNQDNDVLIFNKLITLNHVFYNYPDSSRTALKDITIDIPAKSTIGLIGPTGCGKTTIVDIILGLLKPQKGTLKVDEKVITEQNTRAWQRSIGYVPQNIYLSDDTVEANIAFGVKSEDINQEMVKKASKIANLHDFVTDELPKQYQTIIGERGVRLSGGQRQRIGIARALYHKPKVLILDEATSALDNLTEQIIIEALDALSNDITIILIAHRINTVKNCDIIFLFDKGQLKDKGTFEELRKYNKI